MTEKFYDKFISLGMNCEIRYQLKEKFGYIDSSLLEWAAVTPEHLIEVIENPNIVFSEGVEELSDINMWRCTKTNILFHGRHTPQELCDTDGHRDIEKVEDERKDVIGRIKHLSQKFTEVAMNTERKLYIIGIHPFYCNYKGKKLFKFIKDISNTIQKIANNSSLLVILSKENFSEQIKKLESDFLFIRQLDHFAPYDKATYPEYVDLQRGGELFDEFKLKMLKKDTKSYKFERNLDNMNDINDNLHPKISVITPVYNVEKYLPECLDSIVSQSYNNLEIILVDDGSTDKSYQICQRYAKKDKRIKLLRQENAGPGPARNLGLSKATGDWLSFVDSDDILGQDFFKKLSSHIKSDLNVICSNIEILFDITNQKSTDEKDFYSHKFRGKQTVDYKLKTEINTELWNKIFRRKIFDAYNIDFKSGAFEDGDILFKILAVSSKIYFDNTAIYYYRRRANSMVESLSRGITISNYNAIVGITEELYRLYHFYDDNKLLEKNWKFLLFLLHRNYHFVSSQISVTEQKKLDCYMSDFLEDCVPNEVINKYGIDISLLYKLKGINTFKPFHSRNIKNNVKIAVCYHKPSLLPEKDNAVFFPIHLGRSLVNRSTKDGTLKKEDLQWMLDNMIGDNTGTNISSENRKYCELTALYWAWKNYEKIGSPEYFGLNHYRRIFNLYDVNITADAYMAKAWKAPENAYDQYKNYHKTNEFDLALEIIHKDYPSYIDAANQYCKSHELHLFNIFIMKKELFFKYAEWLFDILAKVEKNIDYTYRTYQSLRALGYLAERLQDIFMLKLKKDGFDIQELPLLQPNEKELSLKPYTSHYFKEAKSIITSCNNNYALYAGVMIQSVIQNTSSEDNYEVYILDGGISAENKKKIKLLETQNLHIDFINMNYYTNKYGTLFNTNTHFTPATYFRFFIPELFANRDKVLYLDPDMIITKDIKELYNINLNGNIIGACRDVEAERKTLSDTKLQNYFYNKLKINDIHNYFQAGVMLCDVKKMIQINFTEQCLNKLKQIGCPMWVDQDIMNSVMQDNVCFIEPRWNFGFFLLLNNSFILNGLDYRIYDQMKEVEKNPYIIHYCGGPKPWINPTLPMADIWWKYARLTSFYEEILQKMISFKSPAISQTINPTTQYPVQNVANKAKYKLFGFIPLWSRRISGKKCQYKLFGLPLFSRKIGGGRTIYKFCGIPVWKIRKMANNITTKYYFCGIPVCKVSKRY